MGFEFDRDLFGYSVITTVIHFTNLQLHFGLFWNSSARRLLSSDFLCSPCIIRFSYSTPIYDAEAEANCRQVAGTLTPVIGFRCDPWPYIYSMSRPLFSFLSFILLIDKGGVGLFYKIGVQ
jgi:hypothetical protein